MLPRKIQRNIQEMCVLLLQRARKDSKMKSGEDQQAGHRYGKISIVCITKLEVLGTFIAWKVHSQGKLKVV